MMVVAAKRVARYSPTGDARDEKKHDDGFLSYLRDVDCVGWDARCLEACNSVWFAAQAFGLDNHHAMVKDPWQKSQGLIIHGRRGKYG